jgi:CBS domain-containing protein
MTHFGDTTVREVMVPRPDMVTIPAGATVREALDKAVDAGLSHLPALDPTIDEIAGVAHAPDLLRALDADRGGDPVRPLLWPAHFVPETKRVAELLAEMQDGHFHMAIVVDEYGGTAGLVSLARDAVGRRLIARSDRRAGSIRPKRLPPRQRPDAIARDNGPSDSSLENARSRGSNEQAVKGDEESIETQVAEPTEPPQLLR